VDDSFPAMTSSTASEGINRPCVFHQSYLWLYGNLRWQRPEDPEACRAKANPDPCSCSPYPVVPSVVASWCVATPIPDKSSEGACRRPAACQPQRYWGPKRRRGGPGPVSHRRYQNEGKHRVVQNGGTKYLRKNCSNRTKKNNIKGCNPSL